jgi:hypothetical protein
MTRKIVYLPDPTITFHFLHESEGVFYASTDSERCSYYPEITEHSTDISGVFNTLMKILASYKTKDEYFVKCLSDPIFYEVLDV